MPNNDLGTAHGRIRIDYDNRGQAAATAALIKMQKQFAQMNNTLIRIEKSLNDSEKGLQSVDQELKKTTKATRGFSSGLFDTHKSISRFSKDTMGMVHDLRSLYNALDRGKIHFDRFYRVVKIFNSAGQFGRGQNVSIIRSLVISIAKLKSETEGTTKTFMNAQRNMLAWIGAGEKRLLGLRSSVSLLGASFIGIRNKIFGVNSAIAKSPGWIKKMERFAISVGLVGTAFGGIALALKPFKYLERLATSGIFNVMVKGSDKLSAGFQKMGVVTQRIFGKNLFGGLVARLGNTEKTLTNFLNKSSISSVKLHDRVAALSGRFLQLGKDSKSLVGGIALLTNSIGNLWGRFQWFFKLPKPLLAGLALFISRVLPTALHGLGVALRGTSNFIVGLWDGIKQLSGGFTVLPGLIATVVAGVTSLIPVFAGLKDQFKDVFSEDPMKAWEAWYKLPDHLKPMAQAIKNIIPRFKELQKNLQTIVFDRVEHQIKALSDSYFPIFERGASKVVVAVRNMKDELVDFLLQTKTKGDISAVYGNTANIMERLAQATKPAAEGLSSMAVEGSKFLSTMSAFAPLVAQTFSAWSSTNSQNGNMQKWMQDAVHGTYNLVKGLKDALKVSFNFLTLFKSNTGENFLQRFADYMQDLNKKAQESSISGWIANLRNGVKNLGENRLKEMKDLFKIFGDTVKGITPFIGQLADSFSGKFIPAMRLSLAIVSEFLQVVNDLGVTHLIGWILGTFAAFRLLPKVLSTTIDSLKGIGGIILILASKGKVVKGLGDAFASVAATLDGWGGRWAKLGQGMENVGGVASKTIGVVGSLISKLSIAGIAFAAFYALYTTGKSNSDAFDAQLETNAKHLLDFRDSLNKAFADDRGFQGKNVMSAVTDGMNNMMTDLEATADKMPGVGDHIFDYFFRMTDRANSIPDELPVIKQIAALFDESDKINKEQFDANQAKLATQGFKDLRDAGLDLNKVLLSSDASFQEFINSSRKAGEQGNAVADAMIRQRQVLQQAKADYEKAGPAAILLAEGLHQIADAGGDATEKLAGFKKILESLGILKTSELDAIDAYEQGLRDLATQIDDIIAKSGGMSDALIKNGTFNLTTQAGSDFYQKMKRIGEDFQAAADVKGLDAAYSEFLDTLQKISVQTGKPIEELEKLAQQVGVVKDVLGVPIDIIFKTKDNGAVELMQALLDQNRQKALGQPIEASIVPTAGVAEAKKAADDINKVLPGYASTDGTNLIVKPITDQAALDAAKHALEALAKPITPSVIPNIIQHTDPTPPDPRHQAGNVPGTVPRNPGAGVMPGGGGGRAFGNGSQAQQDYLDSVAVPLDQLAQAAQQGGEAFTEDFADGILAQKSKVEHAADEVAKAAADRMPGSPAKKGPLSGSGWSRVSGKSFSTDFAAGITSGAGAVGTASSGIAGIAGSNIQNDKSYQAGKFLGQASTLVDFAQHAVDAFSKLTETIIGAAKFMSDPLGKGTFFGKSRAWRRDPGISDEALARQRQLARQQRVSSSLASPQYPNSTIDSYGLPIVSGPVNRESSKADLQRAIAAEGQRVGAKPEDIAAAFAIAQQESGYNPTIVGAGKGGGGADAIGLFQQTLGMWGTMQELTDPNIAIQKYWEHWLQNSGITDALERAVAVQGPASPTNGGYSASTLAPKYAESVKDLQSIFQSGGISQTTEGTLPIPALGQIAPPSILNDSSGYSSKQAAQTSAAVIARLFPQIGNIGGARPDALPYHSGGRAIDIMIPGGTTGNGANPSGKALGDQIRDFFLANADQLGVEDTIWQDFWQPPGAAGRPMNSGGSDTNKHLDHVHITFRDGAIADIGPNGSKLRMPTALGPGIPRALATVLPSSAFGPPSAPNDPNEAPRTQVVRNPDGTFSPVHDGSGAVPGEKLNPLTTQPWTPQEKADYWNRPENQPRFDIAQNDLNDPNIVYQTQQEMASQLEDQTGLLDQIYANGIEGLTTQQAIAANTQLQANIDRLKSTGNTADQVTADYLSGIQGDIAENYGLSQEENPFDVAANIAGAASSIAGSIFSVVDSAFGAINGAKDLTDTLLRGVENTEDLYKMVDQIQTFITLAGDIAGAVSDVTGAISGIVGAAGGAAGGADMGGTSGAAAILGAISTISGLVQSGIDTVNAIIDLGQEAYRIIGSYFGQYLGMVVGGPEGALMGNVKFLLDQQSGQLLAYSQDNPLDKRAHNLAFQTANPNARGQLIGNVNVYGGPGSDPRDNTRQMMWQVKTSTMTQAVGQ